MVDEYRFGLRDVTTDEICDLARAWSILNDGETPAEVLHRLGNSKPTDSE